MESVRDLAKKTILELLEKKGKMQRVDIAVETALCLTVKGHYNRAEEVRGVLTELVESGVIVESIRQNKRFPTRTVCEYSLNKEERSEKKSWIRKILISPMWSKLSKKTLGLNQQS